jgi:acyl phosphate:glycerol-3-phosphate acyltransferase
MLSILVIIAAGYVLGSIPTGVMAGRLTRGIDVREHGSGNTGATNSFRVLGWRVGAVVAIVDILKGFLAVALVARIVLPGTAPPPESAAFIAATLAAVLGHMKPVFAGFKGGKGFGTAAGAVTAAYPVLAPLCLAVFVVSLVLSGYVAVCAAVTALALPFIYLIASRLSWVRFDPVILAFFLLACALTVLGVRRKLALYFTGKAELFERVMIFKPGRRRAP